MQDQNLKLLRKAILSTDITEIKEIVLDVFADMIMQSNETKTTFHVNGSDFHLTPHHITEIKNLCSSNQLIPAIKYIREQTQCGLKEAKDLVDTYFRNP